MSAVTVGLDAMALAKLAEKLPELPTAVVRAEERTVNAALAAAVELLLVLLLLLLLLLLEI